MFRSQGLDVNHLFRAAGVQPVDDWVEGERFAPDSVSRLWELAVQWSGDSALGMNRQLPAQFVNFDLLGHFMLSSPDLKTGLQALANYLALISDAATFELVPEGRHCWLVLGHTGNLRPVPRQRQEYGLLALATMCRWLTRREARPLRVESAFAVPLDADPYRLAFGCMPVFNQPVSRLLLSAEDLEAPLPSRDPTMLALHRQLIDQRLGSMGATTTTQRVHREILRRLHQGEPRRNDVAAALALSDHTLQRRLLAEHTSFQQLLDDARCELARKYLADGRLPLAEVADLLGFVDQSNFFRASKRWFGVPPGVYRSRLDQVVPAVGLNC